MCERRDHLSEYRGVVSPKKYILLPQKVRRVPEVVEISYV